MGELHTLQDDIRPCRCGGKCKDRCGCNKRKKNSENVNIINIGNAPYRNNSSYGVIPPVVIPPPNNNSSVENNNDYHDTYFQRKEIIERPSVFENDRYIQREENPPSIPVPQQKPIPQIMRQQQRVVEEVKKPEYFLIFEDRQVYPEFY